jgi:hypothetical protein
MCLTYSFSTRRDGTSVLIVLDASPFSRLEIEIWSTTSGVRAARVFGHIAGPMDSDPSLMCAGWRGETVPLDSAVLHLSTEAISDLELIHGRLETAGFTIEF